MKLSLISSTLIAALVIGCAAHKAVTTAPVTPVTAQPVTPPAPLPTLPAPDAGTTEDAGVSNATPESDEPKAAYEAEPNADGTVMDLKGVDWELQVTLNQGWRPIPLPVEFAMYNRNTSVLVMVRRVPDITTVNALHTSQLEELKEAGGTLVPGSLRTVKVNGTSAKTWKGNIKGGLFQEWEFLSLGKDPSTGSGVLFSCGGAGLKKPEGAKICTEIVKNFYLGRAPEAP